jgi:hypothetical protein
VVLFALPHVYDQSHRLEKVRGHCLPGHRARNGIFGFKGNVCTIIFLWAFLLVAPDRVRRSHSAVSRRHPYFFPLDEERGLVAIPGIVLFVVWVTFMRDSSWTYCIFSVAVILINWGVLAICSAAHKNDLAALIASLLLAVIWIPGSLHTLLTNLSFVFELPGEALLTTFPVLLIWALIITCVICGFKLVKTPAFQLVSQNGN